MSTAAVGWALRYGDLPLDKRTGDPSSSCAFVLVVLAEHASVEGTDSFPSVATICRCTKLTERTVRYALRALEEHGTIRPTPAPLRRDGSITDPRKRPQSYDIAPFMEKIAREDGEWDAANSGGQSQGGKVPTGGQSPASQGGKLDGDFAPDPYIDPKTEETQEQTHMPAADAEDSSESVIDLFGERPQPSPKAKGPSHKQPQPDTGLQFDRFWKAYPRKIEKKTARAAWDKAVREVDPEIVITAAAEYAKRSNPSYRKYPATWLNAGCWDDDPDAIGMRAVSGDHYRGYQGPTDQSEYDTEF